MDFASDSIWFLESSTWSSSDVIRGGLLAKGVVFQYYDLRPRPQNRGWSTAKLPFECIGWSQSRILLRIRILYFISGNKADDMCSAHNHIIVYWQITMHNFWLDFWFLSFYFWFPSWFLISKLISYSEKLLPLIRYKQLYFIPALVWVIRS